MDRNKEIDKKSDFDDWDVFNEAVEEITHNKEKVTDLVSLVLWASQRAKTQKTSKYIESGLFQIIHHRHNN